MENLIWREEPDGAFVAIADEVRATVYIDDQDPQDEGWAYRVRWEDGHEETGPCDSAEDGQSICQEFIEQRVN